MAQGLWGGEGRAYVRGGVAGGPGGVGIPAPRAPSDAEYVLGSSNSELPDSRVATDSDSIEFDKSIPGEVSAHKKPTVAALTPGTTVASNWEDIADGGTFTLTPTQNFTLANPTGLLNSQKVTYRIKQDATGGRTISLGSAFRFGSDISSVSLSTSPNKVDYLVCYYDSLDAKLDVVAFLKGY